MQNLMRSIESNLIAERKDFPNFKAGDTINIHLKIKEGTKERVQQFQGVVIQRRHPNTSGETFTVRKVSGGIGVERIFPISMPTIEKIEVKRHGSVRRARIYYLRNKYGKSAKVKEKRLVSAKK